MGEPDKGKALLCPGERASAGGVRPGLGSEASKCRPKIPTGDTHPKGAPPGACLTSLRLLKSALLVAFLCTSKEK
jgi:hypothetical protein